MKSKLLRSPPRFSWPPRDPAPWKVALLGIGFGFALFLFALLLMRALHILTLR